MANLQEKLKEEFGKRTISSLPLPDYFETSLSPSRKLRPYQEECFRYFLTYMNPANDFDGKQSRPHLLFHMATGSGKTLIMAGAMLYLYEQGYRNFIFFVDSTNIVEKTKDNFLNATSAKYLFNKQIVINGRRVEIKSVENFQGAGTDCINLCLTTIQGLHTDLNSERENALTYEDFSDQPVVLISDEAHHMNAATKNGKMSSSDESHTKDWESTVMHIFNKDNGSLPNILLEFTATADLADPAIAQKYEDKIIFDYPLKKFREDLYSKEVEVIESDLEPLDRALQAMVLSQYKRKLFADIKQDIKPVILFKSKTIKESEQNYRNFINAVSSMNAAGIAKIKARAKDDLKAAFDYFDASKITADNLILELQSEFSEERLLLVDGNNISPEKQQLLNSLEDRDNDIRGIFAVDMLNEGWDVLNLFDIVRLNDTRDANGNKPGKTTMQEAQLIGRGARYMPFAVPGNQISDKRKFDGDASNPLRVIEKLHYHSARNPRYIQELHIALVQTGIVPNTARQLDLFIKDDFKKTRLYQKGLVFVNERKTLVEMEDDGTLGEKLLIKQFNTTVQTGQMRSGLIFNNGNSTTALSSKTIGIKLKDLGFHILRTAINSFSTYSFDSLKKLYPKLRSIREFIESDNYLANLSVNVAGGKSSISDYSQEDKLQIAKSILKELEPALLKRGRSFRGTKEFKSRQFNKTFRDKIVLNIEVPSNGTQEFGESMKTPKNPAYALDLSTVDWYAYNDNFGTSEEKALVKYIEGKMPQFEEKYDEIYLVRNEKDVKIYDFDEGRAFEPDFLLFLRIKGSSDKFDNLQLFIEPKGGNLLAADKWKNDFLNKIKSTADISLCTAADNFTVWGIPFFNESSNAEFKKAIDDEVLKYSPSSSCTKSVVALIIVPSSDVPEDKRYKQYLPVYSVRAACGSFEDNESTPEDDAEGWVNVLDSHSHIKANENLFVVHAVGNSMLPKIKDGDLCVFEKYGDGAVGSREGEIVLTQCSGKDNDYDCSYTIKKYHSEKEQSEDGTWHHTKVELQSLNLDYAAIELSPEEADQFRTIGILKAIL